MNSIYKLFEDHRSIRKYKSKSIPKDVLEKILHAGTRASSSGNMQAYSIIVTTDKQIKRRLLPLHFNQTMVTEAPALMTFCADFYRMRLWLERSEAPENFDNFMSFLIGMIDATLASQNVALAAQAEGLGICYMGTTMASNHEISKVLELPKHVVPVVGFSIGYPDESPARRERLPLKAVVHNEKYQDYSSDEIADLYRCKEEAGLARYLANPELKSLMIERNAQNLAQVYTRVKYTKESHIEYSKNVMRCLFEQSFLNGVDLSVFQ